MTRQQHLEFCRRCKNREFNAQQGIICGITKKIADFEGTCENFNLDESVKIEQAPAEPLPAHELVANLPADLKSKLRAQQDLLYAIVGGLAAAIVGALFWALITVASKYQIGYMAIAVGLLVGFTVRFFGAGVDFVFGAVGAVFALLGCALGNFLSQVGFAANEQSMGYFDALTLLLNIETIISIYQESFSPMDILFYGIAAYEGYKFAFRPVTEEMLNSKASAQLPPLPYAKVRLPIVLVLFTGLFLSYYFLQKGAVGTRVFFYESGAKRSEGQMEYGVENGTWQYWWENGNVQYTGFYTNGRQDSSWKFYDEEGVLYRTGLFRKGLRHGLWQDYHPNGKVSSEGPYALGRQQGPWMYYYDNGAVSQKGFYKLDNLDSLWELYYPSGQLSSRGSFKMSDLSGPWTYWSESGKKSLEVVFTQNNYSQILNAWDKNGNQQVKDGNGKFVDYYETGAVSETGNVKQNERSGRWKKFTPSGELREEGEYKDGIYYLYVANGLDGAPMIVNGEGSFENYSDDEGTVLETGKISGGLRTGEWQRLFPSGNQETTYNFQNGMLDGHSQIFFESGELKAEGNFAKNKRSGEWKWYYLNGAIETSASYVDGIKQGEQPFYDEDGILQRTEVYSNGKLVNVRVDN